MMAVNQSCHLQDCLNQKGQHQRSEQWASPRLDQLAKPRLGQWAVGRLGVVSFAKESRLPEETVHAAAAMLLEVFAEVFEEGMWAGVGW